ncbi:hypothetical protein [Candidatus Sororendozoicomonas aggregata]|uniref:hypothetical protein n=1 Tax=Candidatus Sororendozoicomonas aggregata TaxID=3073239 RepID=UPI002ED3D958
MSVKSLLRVRKSMASKSFVFFTGVLSLIIMGNAYCNNARIYMKDTIPQIQPHYSKKGYTLKASGHGTCMLGVYGPPKCTSRNGDDFCHVGVHYASALHCGFARSTQNFIVINNDTGKVVGTLKWIKRAGHNPTINIKENPDDFMVDVTGFSSEPNALNFMTKKD